MNVRQGRSGGTVRGGKGTVAGRGPERQEFQVSKLGVSIAALWVTVFIKGWKVSEGGRAWSQGSLMVGRHTRTEVERVLGVRQLRGSWMLGWKEQEKVVQGTAAVYHDGGQEMVLTGANTEWEAGSPTSLKALWDSLVVLSEE
jgi:hypothetical protein